MTGPQADAARSVAENTEAGSTVGDPVTADPKDGDVLTYTLWDAGGTSPGLVPRQTLTSTGPLAR